MVQKPFALLLSQLIVLYNSSPVTLGRRKPSFVECFLLTFFLQNRIIYSGLLTHAIRIHWLQNFLVKHDTLQNRSTIKLLLHKSCSQQRNYVIHGSRSRSTFPPHSITPTLLTPVPAISLNCSFSTAATAHAAAGSTTSFIRSHTYSWDRDDQLTM